eukprot:363881-Chlamydomonas_euryale.AAC.9
MPGREPCTERLLVAGALQSTVRGRVTGTPSTWACYHETWQVEGVQMRKLACHHHRSAYPGLTSPSTCPRHKMRATVGTGVRQPQGAGGFWKPSDFTEPSCFVAICGLPSGGTATSECAPDVACRALNTGTPPFGPPFVAL